MPSSYAELYFPVLLQELIVMALAAGLLNVSYLLQARRIRSRIRHTNRQH
jgi:hypothetical protein